MKDRLDLLLEKYWEGDTTLAEEQEMKTLLDKVPGFAEEKEFFQGLGAIKSIKPKPSLVQPRKPEGWARHWVKIAATIILLVSAGLVIQQYQVQKRKEAQAYAQVMEAFSLIQYNLQKGEKEMEIMDDLKYLNAPHQLFNLNELKNE